MIESQDKEKYTRGKSPLEKKYKGSTPELGVGQPFTSNLVCILLVGSLLQLSSSPSGTLTGTSTLTKSLGAM